MHSNVFGNGDDKCQSCQTMKDDVTRPTVNGKDALH